MLSWKLTISERSGNDLKGFKECHLQNGLKQGQNLTLSVLIMPTSLDSGEAVDALLVSERVRNTAVETHSTFYVVAFA